MRRFIVLLFAVAGILVAAVTPAMATSVEFEYLLGDEVALQELNCDPNGTSTATFVVSGIAGGPHPGTFESIIDVTAGSQRFGSGELLEVNESFRIVSGDSVITGTKHLIPSQDTFYPFQCSAVQSGECEDVSAVADASGD